MYTGSMRGQWKSKTATPRTSSREARLPAARPCSFSFCSASVCFVLTSCILFFFFNDTATTEIYTLSLHDALPIFSGCYVRFNGDEYHIPETPSHRAQHFIHDNLVYASCVRCGKLSTAGHRAYNGGVRFAISPLLGSDFLCALQDTHVEDPLQKTIIIFKPLSSSMAVDLKLISVCLENYINGTLGKDTPEIWRAVSKLDTARSNSSAGIRIYGALKASLAGRTRVSDLRPYRLLWEHKKIMVIRLRYLHENEIIPRDLLRRAADIATCARVLFLAALKDSQSAPSSTSRHAGLLDQMESLEYDLLTEVVEW